MNLPIDAGKLEQLLKEDSALRGKLETSLARLAVKPGAEIDEELLRKAMAEAGLAGVTRPPAPVPFPAAVSDRTGPGCSGTQR